MFSLSKLLAVVGAATAVVAQFNQDISPQCQKALADLANNADASKCLAIAQIPPIFANPDSSVVQPIDNWVKAMCAAQPCSDSTLSTVVSSFIQGCPNWGIMQGDSANVTATVQKYYPVVRKVLCLRDGNTACPTDTLTRYQQSVGTLTLNKLGQFFEDDPMGLPSSVACTNCGKATYNIIIQNFGPDPDTTNHIKQLCGASFVDGQNPSGVSGV